jgi:hypothetical protein
LAETFAAASTFLFFRTSACHPRNFKHTIQATIISKAGNASFVLHARVAAYDISSLLHDPS